MICQHWSLLVDSADQFCGFFSFLQGKLEVRLLGCEDLLNAPTEQENQAVLPEEGVPTTPGSQGSPGETRPFKSEVISFPEKENPLFENTFSM